MKTLLIIRHAKSDHSNPTLADFDRPLNERGIEEAKILGKALRKAGLFPEWIYSSPAKRALSTAELILKKKQKIVQIAEELYPGSVSAALQIVRKIPDSTDLAAIIGHNPALETLVSSLVSHGDALIKLTTAAVAVIDLPISRWKEVSEDSGTLRLLFSGKLVKFWL